MNTQIYSQNIPAQYGFKDNYYIGILNNGTQQDYTNFSNLGLNLWCHYPQWCCTQSNWNNGWTDWEPLGADILGNTYNQYAPVVLNVLSSNSGNNPMGTTYRTIMDRIKILRLCYGQRSDYQAENQTYCKENYKFYSFYHSPDNNI